MSDLTIPNFSKDLQTRLGRRAARKGRSAQAEAREILREAVKDEPQAVKDQSKKRREPERGLASEIRARLADIGYIDWPLPPRHPEPEPKLSNSDE